MKRASIRRPMVVGGGCARVSRAVAVTAALLSGWSAASIAQVQEAPPDTGARPPTFSFPPLPEDAPQPSRDPRDLQGTWVHEGMPMNPLKTDQGEALPYLPVARTILDYRRKKEAEGTPVISPGSLCRPPGLTWDFELNFPFLIAQNPHEVVFLFEEFHSVWRIFLKPQGAAPPPSYEGYSTGHWEGDTLVVRTVGVRAQTWLDTAGSPHSAGVVFEHRIRKLGDRIDIQLTVTDPVMYSHPWSITRTVNWRPDMRMLGEFNCEESTGSVAEATQFHLIPDASGGQPPPAHP